MHLSFLPAGVHTHILHPDGNGRGVALQQGTKVNTGGDELEAPHYDIWIGQRDGSTLPPHGLFHQQELEQTNRVSQSESMFFKNCTIT